MQQEIHGSCISLASAFLTKLTLSSHQYNADMVANREIANYYYSIQMPTTSENIKNLRAVCVQLKHYVSRHGKCSKSNTNTPTVNIQLKNKLLQKNYYRLNIRRVIATNYEHHIHLRSITHCKTQNYQELKYSMFKCKQQKFCFFLNHKLIKQIEY